MNESKIEFLQLGSRQQLSKCEIGSIYVNGCILKSAEELNTCGWMDSSLSLNLTYLGKTELLCLTCTVLSKFVNHSVRKLVLYK